MPGIMSEESKENDLQSRYITFGYRRKSQSIKEWVGIDLTEDEHKGIAECNIESETVGKMCKGRFFFSYQVFDGKIIVTGGNSTTGEPPKSTEIIDCNGPRNSQVIVTSDKAIYPFLNKKRHMH